MDLLLRVVDGSVFDSPCDYLTNTVNTVGAMGAGLALEFRLRVPEMYSAYRSKCEKGEIRIGQYWIYDKPNRVGKKILNFPVKESFSQPSKFEYIIKGLNYFADHYERDGIRSIAFPTLGARLGKLEDSAVLEIMQEDLRSLPIDIEIFRHYAQDKLTKWVKNQFNKMSIKEISQELRITYVDAEQIKSKVQKYFLLSDLAAFGKIRMRLVQSIYDFAFEKARKIELTNFA